VFGSKIGATPSDLKAWYSVDRPLLKKLGFPRRLLSKYDGSLYALLRRVYPDYDWVPWKFKRFPSLADEDPNILPEALNYLERECKIKGPNDWYGITTAKLEELGVAALISRHGGLFNVLTTHKRGFPWDASLFPGKRTSGLKSLGLELRKLFSDEECVENYPLSSSLMVSYYFPTLKVAFLYQPLQSFGSLETIEGYNASLFSQRELVTVAQSNGVRLFLIPFWWDRSLSSLVATLLQFQDLQQDLSSHLRPEVGKPIPTFEEIFSGRFKPNV